MPKKNLSARKLATLTSPAKKAAAKRNAKLPRSPEGLAIFIRDPKVIWYGPHQCNKCGSVVVRSSFQSGGLMLNAEEHEHHYPNYAWTRHECKA